ncbi:(2Fe-2S)-binding protein [Desulfogranum marinum]|jgi:predicted molibdopterin-dependent oxidoreductase YjgC|uniref:(2Fe-2S)-binding protein n=1 Tax=Desulfogranum marinum TaxID=453220 RepID=UPI0019651247|nr:(2Fe-2S)-binding protein [Desulfogranum marinum]MBM9513080.1 (2Fe-2S)-binding protein [Desulfogranum marinum]
MFIPVDQFEDRNVTITIDKQEFQVPEGISVAAAILGHGGHADCRCSFVHGEKRAPFCFIGVCHECLVEIDGKPNQQACLVLVRDGMHIVKQQVKEG